MLRASGVCRGTEDDLRCFSLRDKETVVPCVSNWASGVNKPRMFSYSSCTRGEHVGRSGCSLTLVVHVRTTLSFGRNQSSRKTIADGLP